MFESASRVRSALQFGQLASSGMVVMYLPRHDLQHSYPHAEQLTRRVFVRFSTQIGH